MEPSRRSSHNSAGRYLALIMPKHGHRRSARVNIIAAGGMHLNDVLRRLQAPRSINVITCYTRGCDTTLAAKTSSNVLINHRSGMGFVPSNSKKSLFQKAHPRLLPPISLVQGRCISHSEPSTSDISSLRQSRRELIISDWVLEHLVLMYARDREL